MTLSCFVTVTFVVTAENYGNGAAGTGSLRGYGTWRLNGPCGFSYGRSSLNGSGIFRGDQWPRLRL